jgi:hypothetical protein
MFPPLFSWSINPIRLEERKIKPGAGSRRRLSTWFRENCDSIAS